MTRSAVVVAVAAMIAVLIGSTVQATPIIGKIGRSSGERWQSSYMDLSPHRDFVKGRRLKIRVAGTAKLVCVRLLPAGSSPDQAADLVATKIRVPAGGVLEVLLGEDHPKIRQISVHAGKEAWGMQLGEDNGEVDIQSIDLL
jgi:hypothetical protein